MEQNKDDLSRQNDWNRAPLWICPICGNYISLDKACSRCGFDMRTDYLALRTVAPVPEDDVDKRQACFNAEYAQKKQESIEQESNEGEDQTQDDPDLAAQREQKRVNQQEKLADLKIWMFIVFVLIFVYFDPDLPVLSVLCIVIDIVLFFYYTKEKMR